jgi:hypothetical protein
MKLLQLVRTNDTELVNEGVVEDLDENAELIIATIQYRSTQGGTHTVNAINDFHINGARRVTPLHPSALRNQEELLDGSAPLNEQITGVVVFPVAAGEQFGKLVYTAGRAPKEIDIGDGGKSIKAAVPTSAALVPTRQVARLAQTAIAAQAAEQRSASAREHLDSAVEYRNAGQMGLSLVEIDQALALDPQLNGARELQQALRASATAEVVAAQNAQATAVAAARLAEARATQETRIRAARVLDPRQLISDPRAYVDHAIILQGNALNVTQHNDYTWVQLMAVVPGRSTTEPIVVEFRPKDTAILKDECYRVVGVVVGTQRVTRTLTGATNEVPLVNGLTWQSSPRDRFRSCLAPS